MRIAVLLAIAAVFATAAAQGQEYKSIQRAEAQAAWARTGMSLYDFLGEAKSLMGKTVSVRGVAECLTEMHCYLRDPENPTLKVVIDASALPRNELPKLLACHARPEKCETTITGRVAENASGELRLAGKGRP